MDNYLSEALTAEERKAKIDSNKVVLYNGELEKALGLTTIRKSDLKPRLMKLRQPIDLVPDEDEDNIDMLFLFERIRGTRDEFGRWMLEFTVSSAAKNVIFIPEHTHYLSYRLRNIVNLKSKFSYLLYMYLEDHRYMGNTLRTTVPFLKKLFGVEDVKSYSEFREFNKKVIKVAMKELNEKTDCHVTMTTERPGNKIYYVVFHLEPKKEEPICKPINEQMTLDEYIDQQDTAPIDLYDEYTVEEQERLQTLYDYREGMMSEFRELLSDNCVLACAHWLKTYYGEYNMIGLDNEIGAFNEVLSDIYQLGIDGINDINKYVLRAVQNKCRRGN